MEYIQDLALIQNNWSAKKLFFLILLHIPYRFESALQDALLLRVFASFPLRRSAFFSDIHSANVSTDPDAP